MMHGSCLLLLSRVYMSCYEPICQKKYLSNNGRYDMILRLTKNTSADSNGGAWHQVPEEHKKQAEVKNQMEVIT